ncbi:hypothetical protein QAD02_020849 [Eretmocerus hayati]|uniref:Uncharacterized protein n=1 Tax=Eretmocerus hayati TaxID=131215 RepID=A0ACC2PNI2_9HYME|nr:hypothetical protein QAD02_020849 [Eretmocerus hayati]
MKKNALTSKEDTRAVIACLEGKYRNAYAQLDTAYEANKELLEKLQSENEESQKKSHSSSVVNTTKVSQCDVNIQNEADHKYLARIKTLEDRNIELNAENEVLFDKNELLKDLNDGLKENNALLKQNSQLLEEKIANNTIRFNTTYAEMVTTEHKLKKNIPSIILEPKDNNKIVDMKKVKDVLTEKAAYPIKKITTANNNIYINCEQYNDIEMVRQFLENEQVLDANICLEKKKLPRVRVVEVDSDFINMANDKIENDICKRNRIAEKSGKNQVTVVYEYTSKKTNKTGIILEELQQLETIIDDIDDLNKCFRGKSELILHVNIRSPRKNVDNSQMLVAQLRRKPILLVCTEIWTADDTLLHEIPGYNLYINNSKLNKADGVAVYVMENINHSISYENLEYTCVIDVDIELGKNEKLQEKLKNHVIIGDFNLNILSKDTHADEMLNNFYEMKYESYFKNPTRFGASNTVDSCIDNAYIKSEYDIKSFRLNYHLTDHYPIFSEIYDKATTIPENHSDTNKLNMKKFKYLVHNADWLEILNLEIPEEAVESLVNKCTNILKESEYKSPKHVKPRKPWITNELVLMCREKEKLYKDMKESPDDLNRKARYKSLSKKLDKLI